MNIKIWEDRGSLHMGIINAELSYRYKYHTNWAGHLPGEVIKDGKDVFQFNSFDPVLKEGKRYFTLKIPDNFTADVIMPDGSVIQKDYTVQDLKDDGIKIKTNAAFVTMSGTEVPESHTLPVIVSYRFDAPDVRIKEGNVIKSYSRNGEIPDTLPLSGLDNLAMNNIIVGVHFGKRGGPNNTRTAYLDNFFASTNTDPIQQAIAATIANAESGAEAFDTGMPIDMIDPMS